MNPHNSHLWPQCSSVQLFQNLRSQLWLWRYSLCYRELQKIDTTPMPLWQTVVRTCNRLSKANLKAIPLCAIIPQHTYFAWFISALFDHVKTCLRVLVHLRQHLQFVRICLVEHWMNHCFGLGYYIDLNFTVYLCEIIVWNNVHTFSVLI